MPMVFHLSLTSSLCCALQGSHMSFTGSSYPHDMHAQYSSTFPQLEGLGSAPGLSDQVRHLLLLKHC